MSSSLKMVGTFTLTGNRVRLDRSPVFIDSETVFVKWKAYFGSRIGSVCFSVPSGQTFQQFLICNITTREEDATVLSESSRIGTG